VQGAAIRAVGARIDVTDSSIAGSPGGAYTFAFFAEQSTVSIRQSRITVAGFAGATGIRARGGVINVERSEIRATDTAEFSYIAELSAAEALFGANIVVGARAGDSVVALLEGGSTDWLHNTIVAGTGNGLTAGFYLTGSGTHRVINNILLRRAADAGRHSCASETRRADSLFRQTT